MTEYIEKFLNYHFWDIPFGRIGGFIAVFLILMGVRYFIIRWVLQILKKMAEKTKNKLDDQLIEQGEPPFKMALTIIMFSISINVLNLPPKISLIASHIIRSLFIIALFWAFYRATTILSNYLERWTSKTPSSIDDKIGRFVIKILKVLVFIMAGMILIQEWNYDITGIVTGLGIGGLAFALAAKDMLSNIFGLIMIIADKPFVVGDWIQTGSLEGTVEDIGFRSVRVRTFSHALISVPNSTIANDIITNWSKMGKRRITFNLGVTYSSTPDQITAFTKKAEKYLREHSEIHRETIFVKFNNFGDSSYDIFFYFFTKTTNWGEFLDVQQRVKLDIAKMVLETGLSFAFPSRSVYMEHPNQEEIDKYDRDAKNYLKNIENEKKIEYNNIPEKDSDSDC
ncbi:mechanosensitive ion channel family protein [bacterium]|nr:mechanosensitive ion channel family protein [bacterium]